MVTPRPIETSQLPKSFEQVRNRPRWAQICGEFPLGPYVAIVGTRTPSEASRRSAFQLAAHLALRGVTLLSGGARGIDLAVHEGALEAGGRSVIIAPVTFERSSPSEHRAVYEAVVSHGGAHLAFPDAVGDGGYPAFFYRNEVLAALSQILVVGESGYRGGTMNTVAHARRLGRPLWVLPTSPLRGRGAGSNRLLEQGSRVALSADEICKQLVHGEGADGPAFFSTAARLQQAAGGTAAATRSRKPEPKFTARASRSQAIPKIPPSAAQRDPDDRSPSGSILRKLTAGPSDLQTLYEGTGMELAALQHELLLLQLSGEVELDERGLYAYRNGSFSGRR